MARRRRRSSSGDKFLGAVIAAVFGALVAVTIFALNALVKLLQWWFGQIQANARNGKPFFAFLWLVGGLCVGLVGVAALVPTADNASRPATALSAQHSATSRVQTQSLTDKPEATATRRRAATATVRPTRTVRPSEETQLPPTQSPPTETPAEPTSEPPTPTAGPTRTVGAARVVAVVNANTIDVETDGVIHRVTYIGADVPHPTEPLYAEALAAHRALVEGHDVWLEQGANDTDAQGWFLRYVYVGDVMVNQELIRQGYARADIDTSDTLHRDVFISAQSEAQTSRTGLWVNYEPPTATPLPPTAVPPTQPPAPPPPSTGGYNGPYDPFGPDRDCPDFQTHAQAQAFFIAAGGPRYDPHRLDRDGNGIACENLP
jgi:micrococcal nuclease